MMANFMLTLEACFFAHLLHPLIPTLSELFFQSKDRVIPFGQIKIWFSYLAGGVLQSRNGCKRVSDGFRSPRVCEEEWLKTYQSQVIPTAVQCCDHHLLINNPYWAKETDKEDCVNALSIPLSAVTWKMIYWTVHLRSHLRDCPINSLRLQSKTFLMSLTL